MKDEFGDVIITTMLLAKELHIDVGNAIKKKINKIKKRKY